MKGYTKEQLIKDILSGIIVAIIALPLSIALAIASGVGPVQGLYTAIVAGFFISFFGGSRVQIGGPTEIPIVRRYTTITTAVRTPVPTILWIFSLFILNFPPCYHSPISGDTIQYDSIIAYSAEKIYCDCDKNSPRNPPPEKHIAQKRNAREQCAVIISISVQS